MFDQKTMEAVTDRIALYLPQLGTAILVWILFWLGAVILQKIVLRIGHARGVNTELVEFFGRLARTALLLFGIVTALGTAGIDVAALVAGLGLTGFALGFALKDVVSNVLAGILIMIYKPFLHGDRITVKSYTGTVTQIDLRYTVLRAEDKTFYIPNSILFTDPLTVESRGTEQVPAEAPLA